MEWESEDFPGELRCCFQQFFSFFEDSTPPTPVRANSPLIMGPTAGAGLRITSFLI